jgi:hypothetical protein
VIEEGHPALLSRGFPGGPAIGCASAYTEFVVAPAPHREAPAQADLVVTHGGHGAVIKIELEELEDVSP